VNQNSTSGIALPRGTIALDCDGVLLDYHESYQRAWLAAFGVLPQIVNPRAYWARERHGLAILDAAALAHFEAHRAELFWSTMQPLPGAVAACNRLVAAGFDLVCVSALDHQWRNARHSNLIHCGFPINRVISAPDDRSGINPKRAAITQLSPVAFVDDFAPYLRDIPSTVHRALIDGEPDGSPNTGDALCLADSIHTDLSAFIDACGVD
jgi:hypothetical protein